MAQELSADDVLIELEQRANSLQDASFLVTGKLIDTDLQEFALEIQVQMILDENLIRMDFYQPDAIADNFIILDQDGVYNYNFLTNQVTIYKPGDSQAFGGLFPSVQEGSSYTFTLNMNELFAGWNVSLKDHQANTYQLRFTNKASEGIILGYVDVSVKETIWFPHQMSFYNPEGNLLAELNFNEISLDQNLDPEDLRYIDNTAEVIDER